MEEAEEPPKPKKRGRKPKIRLDDAQNEPELEKTEQPPRKKGRPKSARVRPELSEPVVKKKRGRPSLREKLELQTEFHLKTGPCILYTGPLHKPDLSRKPGKSILKKSTTKSTLPRRRRSASVPAFRPEFRPGSISTDNTESDESTDRLEVQPEFEVIPAEQKPVEEPELKPESISAEVAGSELNDRLERQPELKELPDQREPTEKPELQPESQPEPQPEFEAAPKPQEEHPDSQPKSRRLKPVSIRYRARPFSMRPLFKVKAENGEDRTLIDDTLVDFYLTEYMVNDVFNDQQRAETHVFNSFFYTGLRDRINNKIKVTPRRWELAELFKSLYPKFNLSIFEKKILVIPIYIQKPKHWLLVLIHNPRGATLRLGPPREPEKVLRGAGCSIRQVTKLLAEDRPVEGLDEQCRILLLDSLWGSEQFRGLLAEEHENIFRCLQFFVQMVAAARKEEAFSSKIKSVLCRVPRQKNHVDCGFFMIAFAEYYTTRFTEWTKWPLEALKFLPIDDFTKEQLRSNRPRESIDRLIASLTEN